jgi:hypothetical protein
MELSAKPEVHFTVSVWNRFPHLNDLVSNLCEIKKHGGDVVLDVCMFPGEDATLEEVRELLTGGAIFPTTLTYRMSEFGNGLGHNLAAVSVPLNAIVCTVAVDICMPFDIVSRIHEHVEEGYSFYGPRMFQQCENGLLSTKGGGGALIALYKSDWLRIGGFRSMWSPWGGDRTSGQGEDAQLIEDLQTMGMNIVRPCEQDLYCRWHRRDLGNEFYHLLEGRDPKHFPPWFTVYDKQGNRLSPEGGT